MSERRSWALRQFLKQHPMCCFCGGDTPAETRDEVPPRKYFIDGKWPEGYQFPACRSCNNSSSEADQVVPLFSHFGSDEELATPESRERMEARIQAFARHYPGLIVDMTRVSPHRVREAMRDGLIERQRGKLLREHPLASVSDRMHDYIRRFGAKLALALHYKHSGRIVPRDWPITVRWFGLAEAKLGEIPKGLFNLPGLPTLSRDKAVLSKDFDYRYILAADGRQGVYAAGLRQALFIAATITPPDIEPGPPAERIVRVFGR